MKPFKSPSFKFHYFLLLFIVFLPGDYGWALNFVRGIPDSQQSKKILLFNDPVAGIDGPTAVAVAASLQKAGFVTEFLDAEEICDPSRLSSGNCFLYVIPNAKSYPAEGHHVLMDYLRGKGNLMILGAAPFDNVLWKKGDQWMDASGLRRRIDQLKPTGILYDFERSENSTEGIFPGQGEFAVVQGGADGSALCLELSGNPANNPVLCRFHVSPGSIGRDHVFCFWARGDRNTSQVMVRVHGRDGKIFTAHLLLSTEWSYHVLCADDFYSPLQVAAKWNKNIRRKPGGNQRSPDFRNLSDVEIILEPLKQQVIRDTNRVWIDRIGVAVNPYASFGEIPLNHFSPLETIHPGYKQFPVTGEISLKTDPSQGILEAGEFKPLKKETVWSCYARPEGKGIGCGYKWRWIPLLRAVDGDGKEMGTPVWMLLNQESRHDKPEGFEDASERLAGQIREDSLVHKTMPLEGSACAVCAIADDSLLRVMADKGLFSSLAKQMSRGIFLSRAGTHQFSYYPGERVRLGAVTVNNGNQAAEVQLRITLVPASGGEPLFARDTSMTVLPGEYKEQVWQWKMPASDTKLFQVTAEILHNGRVTDRISHELGTLEEKEHSKDDFVSTGKENFWLHGEKWYPVGVNYWPRYTIALEPDDYTYHWLAPGYYMPGEVEKDLVLLEKMGANFLAIRANVHHDGPNLNDFLRRCSLHGMKVLLFLQSHLITDDPHYFQGVLMPYNFREREVEKFIRETKLAGNPVLLGYDLIWEPAGWVFGGKMTGSFGWKETTPYRLRWDIHWEKWIADRYGSLENAEDDWNFSVPRLDGKITSPTSEQLSKDGPWRVMTAAYRRFMDNLMSRFWNDAVRKLRSMDPNHLITFRQGNLSNLDFTITATPKHVDFFSMEGYSIHPRESGNNVAGFINRYLDYMLDDKPFIWIEYGMSVWDHGRGEPSRQGLAMQAGTMAMIQREALRNGAKGFSPWWWAGGFRVSERSDYGIINPDGSPRPSTFVFEDYARLFKSSVEPPEPEMWYTLDRDSHPGGHAHFAYTEGAPAYKDAVARGKMLGVTTPGNGTTSANTPLLAVGNTPCNGNNPPRNLDAEFNWFMIKAGDGPWTEIVNGATLPVPAGRPILAKASVGNLQDALWLTPASCKGKAGAVYLASTKTSGLTLKKAILKDTKRLQDAEFNESFLLSNGISSTVSVELQMSAEGRVWFGEKLRFTLKPAQ